MLKRTNKRYIAILNHFDASNDMYFQATQNGYRNESYGPMLKSELEITKYMIENNVISYIEPGKTFVNFIW